MASVPSAAETVMPTGATIAPSPSRLPSAPRPIVQALAPGHYLVRCTIGPEAHEDLRRLQALLRREILDGHPGLIIERALRLLLAKVEKAKLGAAASPQPNRPIRLETDKTRRPSGTSRHVPQEVKRAVWQRDAGHCAFLAPTGRRCTERTFLEFHHIQPYAQHGPATVANISLRCRRHNQYEAELVFGVHGTSILREGCASP
jgi:5-methylcytosine-specific restriction endonuclease McrA